MPSSPPDPGTGGSSRGAHPQAPPLDDFDTGGGPLLGDTEPASGMGGARALAAPASAAAVPSAAPVSYSALTAPSSAVGSGVSGAVAMMPPMMPMAPHAGGAGGEDDRRLYRERRVRVETPPNSEPVKGRREPRRTRGEQGSETNR